MALLTIPGGILALIALFTIYRLLPVIYNPKPFMAETGIQSREAVVLIGRGL